MSLIRIIMMEITTGADITGETATIRVLLHTIWITASLHGISQVSNLGVITKYAPDSKAAGQVWVAVSDLISAEPVSGAEIKILNYQLQEIGSGKSGSNGAEMVKLTGRPFLAVVSKGNSTTYLKVTEGNEKSLSRFDTGGEILQKGMKGFIYGERGVWRPGDTLHLTMILHQ